MNQKSKKQNKGQPPGKLYPKILVASFEIKITVDPFSSAGQKRIRASLGGGLTSESPSLLKRSRIETMNNQGQEQPLAICQSMDSVNNATPEEEVCSYSNLLLLSFF